MSGVLDGLRVVELGAWVAAPAAGLILADWGAEVIKVEPLAGDPYRYLFKASAGIDLEINPPFELDNRGKRSIAVDIAKPEGAEIVLRLAADADVFLTNVRVAVLARAGLDYDDLRGQNPRLVYGRVTGHGEEGPDKDRAAFDIGAYWSRAGVAAAYTPDGCEPPFQRGGFGDHLTGLALCSGILGALFARERSGRGQLVTTSLLRAGIYQLGFDINMVLRLGFAFPPQTRATMGNILINCYRTADERWFWLLGLEADRHWPSVARAVGRPEWADDPRYATVRERAARAPELLATLDEVFAARTLEEWIERFDAEGVWFSPVNNAEQVVADPQAHACGAFVPVPTHDGGEALMVSSPVDLSEDRWRPAGPVPSIGEHTDQVLAELGYDGDSVAQLRKRGVVR